MTDILTPPSAQPQPRPPREMSPWPLALQDSTLVQVLGSPKLGGAEELAIALATEQERRGGRIEVWVPEEGPASEAARDAGLSVKQGFDNRAVAHSNFSTLAANLRVLFMALQTEKPILHFHSPILYGLLSRALRLTSATTLAHVHIELTPESYAWMFRRPPNAIVTCAGFLSNQVRHTLKQSNPNSSNVVALPNAVDLDRFHFEAQQADRSEGAALVKKPVALLVGNLSPHKGQETALRAIAHLARQGTAVDLWLAGVERETTGYADELKSLATELGIQDQVQLLGYRNDVEQLMQSANVFLLPSKHEGLPLSILEAQAVGLPVIAAPVAGVPEIVEHGKTGWLVQPDDAEGYAQVIANILNRPSMTSEVTRAAYDNILAKHSWSRYVDNTINLYCSLFQKNT